MKAADTYTTYLPPTVTYYTSKMKCVLALLLFPSSVIVMTTTAEQFQVMIPAFHLNLGPVAADFNKQSARAVMRVAEDVATEYLSHRIKKAKVEEVEFDLLRYSTQENISSDLGVRRRQAECTVCTDTPTKNMERRGFTCQEAKDAVPKRCIEDPMWVETRACEYTCWLEGRGYSDIKECCDPTKNSVKGDSSETEVILKSNRPVGGYVSFTADSSQEVPNQKELFLLLSASLFPFNDEIQVVDADNDESIGLTEALKQKFGYKEIRGSFEAVDPLQDNISGLMTESPTIPPTRSTLLPTVLPTYTPTDLPSDKNAVPVLSTPAPTTAPSSIPPTLGPTRKPSLRSISSGTFPTSIVENLDQDSSSKYNERYEDMIAQGEISEIKGNMENSRDNNISKATKNGDSSTGSSASIVTLLVSAIIASIVAILLGAFYVRRLRNSAKEYDTATIGGAGPTANNENGDKSSELRNFDALYTIDEAPLQGDDYVDIALDITAEESSDNEDVVADLIGCGADLSIDAGICAYPHTFSVPRSQVSLPTSPTGVNETPTAPSSPTSSASTKELKKIEPKIIPSPTKRMTSDGLSRTTTNTLTSDQVKFSSPPLLPLDFDRSPSLGNEVEFDAPTFEPTEWDFNDNDAESTSSELTGGSSHNPFITNMPEHLPIQNNVIPEEGTFERKAYVHDSNFDSYHGQDESSSAASILFSVLGRTAKESGSSASMNDNNEQNRDGWSNRDWNETAML